MSKQSEQEKLQFIIENINDMQDDSAVSKNIRAKLDVIINILSEQEEIAIRVNKALDNLEQITEDVNLEAFTRTQLWNLISILESTFSS